MILKLAYNNASSNLVKELNPTEAYNEDVFKERKDAFALKGSWGAKLTPFAILVDDSGKAVKGFYSEVKECTVENIKRYMNNE